MTICLQVANISISYQARVVLREISFGPLRAGSVTALLGANAAGKSSLLARMAGHMKSPGLVEINGHRVESWPAYHRNRPALVPQNASMTSSLRVFEAVLLACKQGGSWTVQTAELDAVCNLLGQFELSALADRELAILSGGQRQLVSIAQALIRRPAVLLLDEPTSALDLQNQFEVLSLLRRLARQYAICVVIALHDLNQALRFADQVAVLHQGRLEAFGSPDQVLTPARIEKVYGVHAHLHQCVRGRSHLLLDGSARKTPE